MASRNLGTLTLDLVLKLGGFQKGMDQAARISDARLKEMRKRAEAIGKGIGIALSTGFAVASAATAIYIKNTIEAEKVQAQLMSRIKDTAGAAGRSLDQLNDQAAKLQRTTVFDDESIGRAQAALLTYTQIGDVNFDRTIEAATDLATVMGTDVSDAARVLGKALSDPANAFGALRKAGITFTDEQQATIKAMAEAGDQAGAQAELLHVLEGKMGSAAEAARNTLGGALEHLQNAFDNLLEGDGGDAGIVGTKNALNELADTMDSDSVHQGFQTILNGLISVAEKAAVTASAIANLISGVDAFGRSAAQAQYDADLRKEELFKEYAKDGIHPFDPNFGMSKDEVNAELKRLHASNEAYRNRPDASPTTAPVTRGIESDRVLINHDPDLWKKKEAATRGAASADHAAADAAREHEKALEELQKMVEETTQANADFTRQLEDLEAEQSGPLAVAELKHKRDLADLEALAKKGEVSTSDLARAEELLGLEYEKTTAQIKDRLDTGGQQLRQMQQELDLLNLQTDAERARAQFLIDNPNASDAQADAAARLSQQIDETRKTIDAVDEFRHSFEQTFEAVAKGQESVIQGIEDIGAALVEQLIKVAAQQASMALFGQPGTTGGGLLGGLLNGLFGGIFGTSTSSSSGINWGGSATFFSGLDHWASGTDSAPGGWSIVGENGPELMNVPQGAQILPADESRRRLSMGGVNQTVNNYYQTPSDPRTRSQVHNDQARATRVALARA